MTAGVNLSGKGKRVDNWYFNILDTYYLTDGFHNKDKTD